MSVILVTGANGQVGSEIRVLADLFPSFNFLFADHTTLDITNTRQVEAFFNAHYIGYVVNCAAYTAVDRAETEPERAHAINVTGVRNLVNACQNRQIPILHLSTDYVYHGRQNTPIKEHEMTAPKGVYARTKLMGDNFVLDYNHGVVFRTSWVYSTYGNNFVKTILRLAAERPALRIVADQVGTPTYARDLAYTLLTFLQRHYKAEILLSAPNLYHYSNEGLCSWYDFAKAILDIRQIKTPLYPITTAEFPTPASRPPYSVMSKTKIKETLQIPIPYWRDSLAQCLQLMD